jgi:hypothetical protein
MFVMALMTVLCAAGVAFYAKFLLALCKEPKRGPVGYWALLRLGSAEHANSVPPEREKTPLRAA